MKIYSATIYESSVLAFTSFSLLMRQVYFFN